MEEGIIQSSLKSSTKYIRDPSNYLGLTITPKMYNLYCKVLNKQLALWIVANSIISDVQNEFRKGKSILSYDVASGSEITPCNKIDKPLVIYTFTGNVMTSITTLRT